TVRVLALDLDTSLLVVTEGHAGVQTGSVAIQDVEVVDTEREDLRTPVRRVAGVGIEGLVEADRLERVALGRVARRPHAHRGEGQRPDVERTTYVDEPRADVGLHEAANRAVRPEAGGDDVVPIAELIEDGWLQRERPRRELPVHADRVAILDHATACGTGHGAASAGERRRGIHTTASLAGGAGRRALSLEERIHGLDVEALERREPEARNDRPVLTADPAVF